MFWSDLKIYLGIAPKAIAVVTRVIVLPVAAVIAFLSLDPLSAIMRQGLLAALVAVVAITLLRIIIWGRSFTLSLWEMNLRTFLRRLAPYLAMAAAFVGLWLIIGIEYSAGWPIFLGAVFLLALRERSSDIQRFLVINDKHWSKMRELRKDVEKEETSSGTDWRRVRAVESAMEIALKADPKGAGKLTMSQLAALTDVMEILQEMEKARTNQTKVSDEWKEISARIAIQYVRLRGRSAFSAMDSDEDAGEMSQFFTSTFEMKPGRLATPLEFIDLLSLSLGALCVKLSWDRIPPTFQNAFWYALAAFAVLFLLVNARRSLWSRLVSRGCVVCGKPTRSGTKIMGVRVAVCSRVCESKVLPA